MSSNNESHYHPPLQKSQASLLKMHQFSLHEANKQSHEDDIVCVEPRRSANSGVNKAARNEKEARDEDVGPTTRREPSE